MAYVALTTTHLIASTYLYYGSLLHACLGHPPLKVPLFTAIANIVPSSCTVLGWMPSSLTRGSTGMRLIPVLERCLCSLEV